MLLFLVLDVTMDCSGLGLIKRLTVDWGYWMGVDMRGLLVELW